MFTMFEHNTVCLLYLLCCFFKQIDFVKPGNILPYLILSYHTLPYPSDLSFPSYLSFLSFFPIFPILPILPILPSFLSFLPILPSYPSIHPSYPSIHPSFLSFLPTFPSYPSFLSLILPILPFYPSYPILPSFLSFLPILPSYPSFLPFYPSFLSLILHILPFLLQSFLSYSNHFFLHLISYRLSPRTLSYSSWTAYVPSLTFVSFSKYPHFPPSTQVQVKLEILRFTAFAPVSSKHGNYHNNSCKRFRCITVLSQQ